MRRIFYLAIVLMLLIPTAARCQLATCTVSATAVSFGSYSPFSSQATTSTGTVTVRCGALRISSYTITLSTGLSGTFSNRTMSSGSARLSYQLYLNSTDTSVWGNGTDGTSTRRQPGFPVLWGALKNYTVYGKIPASQTTAPPGSYTDSITVTVTY